MNKFANYWPLLALIITSLLGAAAIFYQAGHEAYEYMHYFMGIFLLFFSLLKLFDPIKFAQGFSMYDILAKRIKVYGYIYPLIELLLALLYLSFACKDLTYWATVVIFSVSGIGVIIALRKGLDLRCACMGSVLKVPLSTVTLTEDISMIIMSIALLLR